jgi:DNA (cytosine-5)-methyltransferase 1
MDDIELGSLFDGIGGFPLAASQYGIKTIWSSEIDAACNRVTAKHFPDVTQLGDITKIKDPPPVDIITFGSPCQDLSVAGNQKGLAGARSGLFLEAIRIIKEMRFATNGKYPRFAIWENVPGAFSSNKGQDFRKVLEAFTNAKIDMPRSGKWPNAGMVRSRGVDLSWRVFDAQYWGVPQRRKRIYLVADFGGRCSGEVLFKPEGLSRYFKTSRDAREEVAAGIGKGFNESGRGYWTPGLQALRTNGSRPNNIICHTSGLNGGATARALTACKTAAGRLDPTEQTFVLDCRNLKPETVSTPLRAKDSGGQSLNYVNPVFTLAIRGRGATCQLESRDDGKANALLTPSGGRGGINVGAVMANYKIRRLTPLECERLQGFPDNWTAGESDSARYRMLGNSLALPCPLYILGNIADVFEREELLG